MNFFQISTFSSYSKVISWNQLKIYLKHIQIFLKLLQNFPKISQSSLKTCVKLTLVFKIFNFFLKFRLHFLILPKNFYQSFFSGSPKFLKVYAIDTYFESKFFLLFLKVFTKLDENTKKKCWNLYQKHNQNFREISFNISRISFFSIRDWKIGRTSSWKLGRNCNSGNGWEKIGIVEKILGRKMNRKWDAES